MVREHTGFGWGDPVDPAKNDLWLCNGYVCVYDPMYAGRVELWTPFGKTDSRYALTNSGRAREEEAIGKARSFGKNYRPWYADCADAQIQPNIPDLTDEEWEILFHLYPELKARLQKMFDAHDARNQRPA